MIIVDSIAKLARPQGRTTGFVPTMGALHEGHLELMKVAKQENERVVVSVFVNPTQFGPNEDFERYPRDLERDARLAESVGVDELFVPTVEDMYRRMGTKLHVPGITERWDGAARPGHFDGVTTVVAKLFNIVEPTIAYFGLKDLQQCMVIERMVDDLNFPVRLSFQPTVREADGLAMSSRNAYLTSELRAIAPRLHHSLSTTRLAILDGADPQAACAQCRSTLENAGFVLDYLALVDLPDMVATSNPHGRTALIVAAKLGDTRLIDNVLM